jgi:hypothetical protein
LRLSPSFSGSLIMVLSPPLVHGNVISVACLFVPLGLQR